MNIAIISITKHGGIISSQIFKELTQRHFECKQFCYYKYPVVNATSFQKLLELIETIFTKYDALLFVCACGIVVRSIAPHIKSKYTDPCVISIDEQGKFVISVLSGHIGRANRLSEIVSQTIGGVAVVTTATDVNKLFSVDSFAVANGLHILDMATAKDISSAIVNGEKIGFYSQYEYDNLPKELVVKGEYPIGVCVSDNPHLKPFTKTLNLIPKNLIIGVGCKKDISFKVIDEHVKRVLLENKYQLYRIKALATIDIKKDEKGIIQFCKEYKIPMYTYSAKQLMQVQGEFTASDFVLKITGTDNVCERAAKCCSNGDLVVKKSAVNGVTVAIAEEKTKLDFNMEIL